MGTTVCFSHQVKKVKLKSHLQMQARTVMVSENGSIEMFVIPELPGSDVWVGGNDVKCI